MQKIVECLTLKVKVKDIDDLAENWLSNFL